MGVMRIIVGFLLIVAVIAGIYFFVPIESIRKRAKNTIDKVNTDSPSVQFNKIKSGLSNMLDTPQSVPVVTEGLEDIEGEGSDTATPDLPEPKEIESPEKIKQ